MSVEETVKATLIIMESRGLIEWPSYDMCETIINDVMVMLSENETEEDYDEGQPDWYQEWHDFDPEA